MEYVCVILFEISAKFDVVVSLICDSAHTHIVRVPLGGEDDPPQAGPLHRFCVISAGETMTMTMTIFIQNCNTFKGLHLKSYMYI